MNMRIFGIRISFGGQKSVPDGAGKPAQTSSSSTKSSGWTLLGTRKRKKRTLSTLTIPSSKVEPQPLSQRNCRRSSAPASLESRSETSRFSGSDAIGTRKRVKSSSDFNHTVPTMECNSENLVDVLESAEPSIAGRPDLFEEFKQGSVKKVIKNKPLEENGVSNTKSEKGEEEYELVFQTRSEYIASKKAVDANQQALEVPSESDLLFELAMIKIKTTPEFIQEIKALAEKTKLSEEELYLFKTDKLTFDDAIARSMENSNPASRTKRRLQSNQAAVKEELGKYKAHHAKFAPQAATH